MNHRTKSTERKLPQQNAHVWPGLFGSIVPALKALKYNQTFLSLYLVLSAMIAVVEYFSMKNTATNPLSFQSNAHMSSSSVALSAASLLIGIIIAGPLFAYIVNTASERQKSIAELCKQGLSRLLPLIGVFILIFIMVGVGTIVFIIPGIILLVRIIFAAYIVMDKDLGPIEAIKESFRLSKGNYSRIFGFILFYVVLSIIELIISSSIPVVSQVFITFMTIPISIIGYWIYKDADSHAGRPRLEKNASGADGWKLPNN